MSNQKYNSDEFIQFLINYFKDIPPEKKKKSFRKLYQEEIQHSGEKKGIRLPCFSQARNILLSGTTDLIVQKPSKCGII